MSAPAPNSARWWRYVKKRQLTCPSGHHLPETQKIPEYGFIRCGKWIDAEKRECGLWVFVYAVRGGGAIVAEVSQSEMREMESLHTPSAMLEFLDILEVR